MGVPTARPIGRRSLCLGSGAALVMLAVACGQPDTAPYAFTQTREGHRAAMTDEERAQLQEAYKSTMSGG